MRNDGWEKGSHQHSRQVALSLSARNGWSCCYFCRAKVTLFPVLGDQESPELFTSLRGRKFCSCHKRVSVVHGSPSAELGQVAEERVPVDIAMCLSVSKAECPFTPQSLTWDPGFCTEHSLAHFFGCMVQLQPSPTPWVSQRLCQCETTQGGWCVVCYACEQPPSR